MVVARRDLTPDVARRLVSRIKRSEHEYVGLAEPQQLGCFKDRANGDAGQAESVSFFYETFVAKTVTVAFDYRDKVAIDVLLTGNRGANVVTYRRA